MLITKRYIIMKNSIRDGLKRCLNFVWRKIMKIIFFIYELMRYPIKNISIWIIGFLTYFMHGNVTVNFKGNEMFLMSVGLVSIMIFISNFLDRQTVDIDDKNNFYLGHNLKKFKFHDNFWFKRFNEVPISLLFWIIASFPIIVICSELQFNSKFLNNVFKNVNANIKHIEFVWLAVFIVISIYFTALLIESVALSSKSFSQSYLYSTTNLYEKDKINKEIKHYFKNSFNYIFNFKALVGFNDHSYQDIELLINYIINRGKEVALTDEEIKKFYSVAFECEQEKIDELQKKLEKYIGTDKDKKIIVKFNTVLLKKTLNFVRLYYIRKWDTLSKLDVLPSEIVKIAYTDLMNLFEFEEKLNKNKEYREIFWGNNRRTFKQDVKDERENLCISKIHEVISEKYNNILFLTKFNDTELLMDLFKVLNKIDLLFDNLKKSYPLVMSSDYFPSMFKIIFKKIIDNKNKDIDFIESFCQKMSESGFPGYIIKENIKLSKEKLLNGDLITNDLLKYLLQFMDLKDVVVVLIFRLAYLERSRMDIMTRDEFEIWEDAIEKLKINTNINVLKDPQFIKKVSVEISKSRASHTIFDKFIKWMCLSLFVKFDEKKYEEFLKLGKDRFRNNFSLNRYIIVRLLLDDLTNNRTLFYDFKDEKKNQIKKELADINEILKIKGVYI